MKLNLNELVTFQLTPFGKSVLNKYVADSMLKYNYPLDYNAQAISDCLVKPRSDGQYEAQVWQLMQVFGQEMWNGNDVCFVDNIIEIQGVAV